MIDFAQRNGGGCEASEVALLVKEAADGDAAAWNELVERFAGLVSSIARSRPHQQASAMSRLKPKIEAWSATEGRRQVTRRNLRFGSGADSCTATPSSLTLRHR